MFAASVQENKISAILNANVVQIVFTHVASSYANLLEQKKERQHYQKMYVCKLMQRQD